VTVTSPLKGQFVIPVLKHRIANHCTILEVASFSRSRDILGGNKNFNESRDHKHAPFRDDLSSVCWDYLRFSSVSNLKSLYVHSLYEDTKGDEKCRNWGCLGVRGHTRSSET